MVGYWVRLRVQTHHITGDPNKNSTILRLTWEKIQLLLAILDYYFNGFLKIFQVLFLLF